MLNKINMLSKTPGSPINPGNSKSKMRLMGQKNSESSKNPQEDSIKTASTTSTISENRRENLIHLNLDDSINEMLERQAAFKAEQIELAKQLENAKEAAKAQAEAMRLLMIAMKIASRIMRGDNVPQSDMEFLLEHSPGMFMMAMSARNYENENPTDHEALAKDVKDTKSVEAIKGEISIPSESL